MGRAAGGDRRADPAARPAGDGSRRAAAGRTRARRRLRLRRHDASSSRGASRPAGRHRHRHLRRRCSTRAARSARGAGRRGAASSSPTRRRMPFAPASVDVLFSRFGVMFFADPDRRVRQPAPRAARRAAVWRSCAGSRCPRTRGWSCRSAPRCSTCRRRRCRHPTRRGRSPSPIPTRVRGILDGAGFRDVAVRAGARDAHHRRRRRARRRPSNSCCRWVRPRAALREAEDPTLKPRVAAAVREALVPYVTAQRRAHGRRRAGSSPRAAHSAETRAHLRRTRPASHVSAMAPAAPSASAASRSRW